ncbi:hypothetical protein CVT25_014590 [Psilocybe cyanescens]|uniref:Uncharacterized protein n=1 Tax=Psilocybe cyanescens TaxID=93625 RepID=A0A409XRN5_PSICY|nr:hypothetical protein CVT25_014590 [Psilocybe cyanescens]
MIEFKNKNIRGQRDGTRSTSVIDRVHEKARFVAAKYRAARKAQMMLVGPGEWETWFCVLEDGDIRGYQDPSRMRARVGRRGTDEDGQVPAEGALIEEGEFVLFNEIRTRRDGTGETRRMLSWIWTVGNSGSSDDERDDVLQEEMRRTLTFLEWKANWWRDRQSVAGLQASKDLQEGLSAYSLSQADVQDSLAAHFRKLWQAPLQATNTNGCEDDNDDNDETDAEDVQAVDDFEGND